MRSNLENIKKSVESTYSRLGNSLTISIEKNPKGPSAHCYKYIHEDGSTEYIVYCSQFQDDDEANDYLLMHEYGHIYLCHLDENYRSLEKTVNNMIMNNRSVVVQKLNESLEIDFADDLVDKLLNDKGFFHNIVNIAMDMEVNSSVLCKDDVEYLEKKFTVGKNVVKLVYPTYYKFADGTPFPEGLTYPEYLMLLVKNLNQLVKHLVSLSMGKGNSGMSGISSQDIKDALDKSQSADYRQGYQDALNDLKNQQGQGQGSGSGQCQGQDQDQSQDQQGQGQGQDQSQDQQGQGSGSGQSEDYKKGYQDALDDAAAGKNQSGIRSLEELLNNLGMSGGQKKSEGDKQKDSGHKDYEAGDLDTIDERPQFEKDLGEIISEGKSDRSATGGNEGMRTVMKTTDVVDEAIDEVIHNVKNRVIKREFTRDVMKKYNRGIIKSVISPSISYKVTTSVDVKLVFLIDTSGSMDSRLVDRILNTISIKLEKIDQKLKYDIIAWDTDLAGIYKDISPKALIPRISIGGGTRLARGIRYFKENYDKNSILIIISDFEDSMSEWKREERDMNGYDIYGWNYGSYSRSDNDWVNLKQRNFSNYRLCQ